MLWLVCVVSLWGPVSTQIRSTVVSWRTVACAVLRGPVGSGRGQGMRQAITSVLARTDATNTVPYPVPRRARQSHRRIGKIRGPIGAIPAVTVAPANRATRRRGVLELR